MAYPGPDSLNRGWFDPARGLGMPRGMPNTRALPGEDARHFRPARSCAYEGWTVVELKKRAKQLGISGYSGLNKEKLIALIRNS